MKHRLDSETGNGPSRSRARVGHLYEYAWDDVNNMELPIAKVRDAREEVKKSSTKWVGTDKSHGNGEIFVRSRWG